MFVQLLLPFSTYRQPTSRYWGAGVRKVVIIAQTLVFVSLHSPKTLVEKYHYNTIT